MDPSNISLAAGGVARDSQAWIERLSATGAEHDAALVELHALLLRAARFEVNRRRAGAPHLRGSDYDDLAHQSADDALVAILRKLGDFRGDSRFTTWAYKFALYEAAAKVRKRAWQGREIPVKAETWPLVIDDHQRTYVELELANASADEVIPGMRAHLEGCSACAEDRDSLRALLLSDASPHPEAAPHAGTRRERYGGSGGRFALTGKTGPSHDAKRT